MADAWSPMASLELTDEEKMDRQMPAAVADMPSYPYGTCISLCNDELDKLGCDVGDFASGDIIMIKAIAKVTGTSTSDTAMGPKGRVELQITDMAILGQED